MEEELNFNEIAQMIEIRKNNAYRKVNEELIGLYCIGIWENILVKK